MVRLMNKIGDRIIIEEGANFITLGTVRSWDTVEGVERFYSLDDLTYTVTLNNIVKEYKTEVHRENAHNKLKMLGAESAFNFPVYNNKGIYSHTIIIKCPSIVEIIDSFHEKYKDLFTSIDKLSSRSYGMLVVADASVIDKSQHDIYIDLYFYDLVLVDFKTYLFL